MLLFLSSVCAVGVHLLEYEGLVLEVVRTLYDQLSYWTASNMILHDMT